MKAVLIVVALTLLAVNANGQCPVPTYTQNVVPACNNGRYIKLPNYENFSTFYGCATGTPILNSCGNEYFSYVLQECSTCDDFIPPVPCSDLSIDIKCDNITSQSSTTAKVTTVKSTTVAGETTTKASTTPKSSTTTSSTTTTPSGTTIDINGPPSPGEPGVPTPPEDPPTAPIIPDEPGK